MEKKHYLLEKVLVKQRMNDKSIYKIKDSVDLFLSNDTYIMAYYMNTRQRKSFKVNNETIYLLEMIDGKSTLAEIKVAMNAKYNVNPEFVYKVLEAMIKQRIITEALSDSVIILDQNLIKRYTRQINYFSEFLDSEEEGLRAQQKLIDARVLIFGAGAVGGNIALELAMAGVGNIVLYDFDKVEESDTARHMYYRNKYIGMRKIDALAEALKEINSEIKVEIIFKSMKPNSDVEKLIMSADFIVNTMDEPYIGYTASKISRICIKHKLPHYIAGGFDAHLASTGELIIPYITPCVECYAGYFKETLKNWKPKKHPVNTRYREIGGLSSLSLFSSSYACIEIIKYIAGLISMEDSFKFRGEFLFHDMSLTYLNIKKNPECPVCGGAFLNES